MWTVEVCVFEKDVIVTLQSSSIVFFVAYSWTGHLFCISLKKIVLYYISFDQEKAISLNELNIIVQQCYKLANTCGTTITQLCFVCADNHESCFKGRLNNE